MTPWWISALLAILVAAEGAIIAGLFSERKARREKQTKDIELTADAKARQHVAELDAEAKFTAMLLGRLENLENQDRERQAQSEQRREQIHKMELANQLLSLQLDAVKLELAGKINAAVSTVEKAAATVLSEAQKKGSD